MSGPYAPHWPSLTAAVVAVVLCGAALTTGLVDPERTAQVRWRLWVWGGTSLVLSLVLFALEGLRYPGATP